MPWSGSAGGIVVQNEAPGMYEDRDGKPYIGPAGQLLRSEIRRAGADPESWAYLYTVSCWPHDVKPSMEQLRACRPNLDDQLDLLDPTWVVISGSTALSRWVEGGDIIELSGHPMRTEFRGRTLWLYPIVDPAQALVEPALRARLRTDLHSFVGGLALIAKEFDAWHGICIRCGMIANRRDSLGLGWCDLHWRKRVKVAKHPTEVISVEPQSTLF